MAITKERRNHLIRLADKALNEQKIILRHNKNDEGKTSLDILESYNGQVASLSVSIAMAGLLPTLAIFYQDKPDSNTKKAYRRNVLDVVARMITADGKDEDWNFSENNRFAENLMAYAVAPSNIKKLDALKQEMVECAIVLKLVVRTYNLVKS